MSQANWIIFLHVAAVWLSVITSQVAGWTLSVHPYLSLALGVMMWALGFLFNLRLIASSRSGAATHATAHARRSYQRIAARTIMNLGIGIAFRSWLTLLVAGMLIPFYASAARQRRNYLDYLRTGMLSDAFPHRVRRHQ
jgi:hypothetical protein